LWALACGAAGAYALRRSLLLTERAEVVEAAETRFAPRRVMPA
jgi:hypothetical protein